MGRGKNANIDGKEGTEKGKPSHKKATKASQIKSSQNNGDKASKSNSDTLLGDPICHAHRDGGSSQGGTTTFTASGEEAGWLQLQRSTKFLHQEVMAVHGL